MVIILGFIESSACLPVSLGGADGVHLTDVRGGPHVLAGRGARTSRAVVVAPMHACALQVLRHEVELRIGCVAQGGGGGVLWILYQIEHLCCSSRIAAHGKRSYTPPVVRV